MGLFSRFKEKNFEIENGVLIKYRGTDTDVVIPSGVTAIYESAFYESEQLVSVRLHGGVSSLGDEKCCYWNAFLLCPRLENITVDEDNKTFRSIDGNLYTADARTLLQYAIGKKAIRFTIPSGVERIGPSAFSWCKSLMHVDIAESVKVIEECAFSNCFSLSDITVTEGITSISRSAFECCEALSCVRLPKSIKRIGNGAFNECRGLRDVYYDGTAEDFRKIEIGDENLCLLDALRHYSDGEIECTSREKGF